MVAIGQLRCAGISEDAIRRRVAAGHLHRVHQGVYALGHKALAPEGRALAAVLAIGKGPRSGGRSVLEQWGAAVSHRSAATLWGLLPEMPDSCEVIVAGDGGRSRRVRIRVHRSRSLGQGDVTLCRRIPITTPTRTIADLRLSVAAGFAGAPSPRQLRRAIRQANVLGLPIDESDAEDRSRGDLEEGFLELCRRHHLPRPEVNVRIGPHLVDFFWRERGVAVETDHYLHHRGRQAFQDDRGRDLDLKRRGFDVVRLAERQIEDEADQVAVVLRAALEGREDASPAR